MNLDRFQSPESGDDNRFRSYGNDPEVDANDKETCPNCDGSGEFKGASCKACQGQGEI